jgi:hypothetical protein
MSTRSRSAMMHMVAVLAATVMVCRGGALPAAEPPAPTSAAASPSASAPATSPAASVAASVRLPETVTPDLGCWFWSLEEFQGDGYRTFLDLAAVHSPFRVLTTSMRVPKEITDPDVHDQIKAAAAYARSRGLTVSMDLDVRLARAAFQKAHPDEMQEMLRIVEAEFGDAGEVAVRVAPIGSPEDHMTWGSGKKYYPLAGRLVRVYAYVQGPDGIDPDTVRDITADCRVEEASAKQVSVIVPCGAKAAGRKAAVMAAFTHFTPDVFAPHLLKFQRGIVAAYKDTALGGADKDEWGFPASGATVNNDFWFSKYRAEAYAQRTGGRDLVHDCLLMHAEQRGRKGQRQGAINHFVEMNWQRNARIEEDFYQAVKEAFGKSAFVGVHATWVSALVPNEINKNGWDWWAVPRDYGQTDEYTPYPCRTSLAKKWGGGVWYNMFYATQRDQGRYAVELWQAALAGGRVNYHQLFPHPTWVSGRAMLPLLEGDLMRGQCRIRLLNLISPSPLDCPVAVVFGHPFATNWAGPKFLDSGVSLAENYRKAGYPADLIPSTEIGGKALRVGEDGYVYFGPQRYAAVVLYQPDLGKRQTAEFWQAAAAGGKTALYRFGDWATDFDGNAFSGNAALPGAMEAPADITAKVPADLRRRGVPAQGPPTRLTGQCRLIDGTEVIAAGDEKQPAGLPINTTLTVAGHEVTLDAIGIAAVRLSPAGQLEALAAGGLKSFRGGGVALDLPARADIALWRDRQGAWQGVLQGLDGSVPPPLLSLCPKWLRLAYPVPYRPEPAPGDS